MNNHTNSTIAHSEFPIKHNDLLLNYLHWTIRAATKFLAILMTLVILWGVFDVIYIVYSQLAHPPYFQIRDIMTTFGAFLAVLIAYEIFTNITLYIRTDVFPVQLVVATALMAVARKVIALDLEKLEPLYLLGLGSIVMSLGISYWLIVRSEGALTSKNSRLEHSA